MLMLTHDEMVEKYNSVAEVVKTLIDADVQADWIATGIYDTCHTIVIQTREDAEEGLSSELYDRRDSKDDIKSYGPQEDELWVLLHHDEGCVTGKTVEEVLCRAIAEGWFPAQPKPSVS